jgi:hypothetical protein
MNVQMGASTAAMRAHEELFAYWSGLRRGGRLPQRADIDPAGFKRLLPSVSLIDVDADRHDFRLRLAGTGLYSVYGGEITGKRLSDIYNTSAAEYWRTELDKVVRSRKPVAGYHSLAWRGAAHMTLLWLRLPLASNGSDVDMILGYDAVVGIGADSVSGIRAA